MVSFPNGKINLGLHVLGKRADGYHDIETVFYPLAVRDVLEITPLHTTAAVSQINITGLAVAGDANTNLCLKAWQILKRDFLHLPPVAIYLHKAIPMGAGLGGGSADGAFMLQMLNEKYDLQLSTEGLMQYALQLGSDCPFFIINKMAYATGRGEVLQAITLDLNKYDILVVNPNIHISTKEAFAHLQLQKPAASLLAVIQQPVAVWKDELINDFEQSVSTNHPEINLLKQQLYENGAVYASMTGSGSTVYALFEAMPTSLSFPAHYFSTIIPAKN